MIENNELNDDQNIEMSDRKIKSMENKIDLLSSKTSHLEAISLKIGEIENQSQNIKSISERFSNIEHGVMSLKSKIPNLITIIGIITVGLGFFGYSNIRQVQDAVSAQMHKKVSEFTEKMSENVDKIDKKAHAFNKAIEDKLLIITNEIERQRENLLSTSDILKNNVSNLASSIDAMDTDSLEKFVGELNNLSNLLKGQNSRIKTIDKQLARISSDVSLFSTQRKLERSSQELGLNEKSNDINFLDTISRQYSSDPAWGPYFKGKSLLTKNDIIGARELFFKGLQHIDKKDKDLFYEAIGYTFFLEKKYKQAIAKYEDGLFLKPESPILLNSIGNCYYRLSLIETEKEIRNSLLNQAYMKYKKSYLIDPQPVYLSNQALMLTEQGEVVKSINLLQTYKGSPNILIHMQFAENYSIRDEKLAAIDHLRKVLELDKNNKYLFEIVSKSVYKNLHEDEAFINLIKTYGGNEILLIFDFYWKKNRNEKKTASINDQS